MKLRSISLILFLILVAASCSTLRHIDHPGANPEDRWIKSNTTPWQVKQELIKCGLSYSGMTLQQQIDRDNCMLANGFIFVDSPYGHYDDICKLPQYKDTLPSCLSMRQPR